METGYNAEQKQIIGDSYVLLKFAYYFFLYERCIVQVFPAIGIHVLFVRFFCMIMSVLCGLGYIFYYFGIIRKNGISELHFFMFIFIAMFQIGISASQLPKYAGDIFGGTETVITNEYHIRINNYIYFWDNDDERRDIKLSAQKAEVLSDNPQDTSYPADISPRIYNAVIEFYPGTNILKNAYVMR